MRYATFSQRCDILSLSRCQDRYRDGPILIDILHNLRSTSGLRRSDQFWGAPPRRSKQQTNAAASDAFGWCD